MKLEHFINNLICEYPTLYRSKNHERSRIEVLGHIFLCYGTGLEWHKDGFLANFGGYDDNNNQIFEFKVKEAIPENFYDMELWEISLSSDDFEIVKALIETKFFYSYQYSYQKFNYNSQQHEYKYVFECNKELADKIKCLFEKERNEEYGKLWYGFCHQAKVYSKNISEETLKKFPRLATYDGYTPYEMCRYSPLVEMINRRTDSTHIDNFDLTFIQPDWIQGALDIARYTLDFYNDSEKNKWHHCHPSKTICDFKKSYDKDPQKYRQDRINDGMKPEHTIEQWCEICWQKTLKEQLGYCEKFIEMYGDSKEK